ncbi:MAG: hypothetical protein PUE93_04660, partial [Acidaminococcus sp.]|nr:hypothetical protein [Acidaminococcus sp.]
SLTPNVKDFPNIFCALGHILCASFFTQFLVFLFAVNNGGFPCVLGSGTVLKQRNFLVFGLNLDEARCIEYQCFTKSFHLLAKK